MGLLKRKPTNAHLEGDDIVVVPRAPDLAGEILRLRAQIESFVDAKVAELRASRDGQSQPADSLRLMLTQGSGCLCAVAMNILAERGNV
jgi:hypothetical protein